MKNELSIVRFLFLPDVVIAYWTCESIWSIRAGCFRKKQLVSEIILVKHSVDVA